MPNIIVIDGNLTKDPLVLSEKFTKLRIANNSFRSKGKDGKPLVTFVDVCVVGKAAVNCAKYLKSGNRVLVEGELNSDSYKNKEDQTVNVLQIVTSHVDFLTPPVKKGDVCAPSQDDRQQDCPNSDDSEVPF